MMRDINSLMSRQVFDVVRILTFAAVYVLLYTALFSFLFSRISDGSRVFSHAFIGLFFLAWLMAMGWIAGIIFLHVKISRSLSNLETHSVFPTELRLG